MFIRALASVLLFVSLCAAQTETLTKYFVAFLYKGPQFSKLPADSPERKANSKAHLAFIEKMTKEGKMITYGPILDGGDLRGMFVFKAASIEEAREWANQEPSVQIGMIEMRVYAWLAPASLATPRDH